MRWVRGLCRARGTTLSRWPILRKLEAEGESRAPQFLSSHPNPGNRVEDVQAEIRTLPPRSYEQTAANGEFREMKQLVAQLPKPDRPVERATRRHPAARPWNPVRSPDSKPSTRTSLPCPIREVGAFMATETRVHHHCARSGTCTKSVRRYIHRLRCHSRLLSDESPIQFC